MSPTPARGFTFSRLCILACALTAPLCAQNPFPIEEATIASIQQAIQSHQITTVDVVKMYLGRIKAYGGPSVHYPDGMLGTITPDPEGKGIGAIITVNLRPAHLQAMGLDPRTARTLTDKEDSDPSLPDALEVAEQEDKAFAATGKLVGPLHGVVIVVKDQYDTIDMRTTSGADTAYANDRPPHDATNVKKLRAAGAIIIGKGNMGEYAGGYGHNRSSYGGQVVNPYDRNRDPGGSSSGVGAAVGANLCTVGIAEETTPSIRSPAQNANCVGLSPTQELVSRYGMMNSGINTRTGPIARTVEDAARILTVIAGFDPLDEETAFNVGRIPDRPYESFVRRGSLQGMRIGVVREYMDRTIATKAEIQNIELAEHAIEDLRRLGATIVDPDTGGIFTPYLRKYYPRLMNFAFAKAHPELFPVDADGNPMSDQIPMLIGMYMDPAKFPGKMTIRDFPGGQVPGETKFGFDLYLAERGDANIKTFSDMLTKARYYNDGTRGSGTPNGLKGSDGAMVYDTALRMQKRYAVQQIVLMCMAELKLDALVYPTGTLPPGKIFPLQPRAGGGGGAAAGAAGGAGGGGGGTGGATTWTFLGTHGFPAITVPGGFTSEVYDREPEPAGGGRPRRGAEGRETPREPKLIGPTPAVLPVGFDFLGRPFSEPTLLTLASAYEEASKHRHSPPGFGPVAAAP